MAPDDNNDKRIRRLEDNPAGRVVTDPVVNRWEWSPLEQDETARLLRALQNDELQIERSSITRNARSAPRGRNEADVALDLARDRALNKSGGRDAGGGFDPYHHSGKPRRR
jgi:hypothetical protein